MPHLLGSTACCWGVRSTACQGWRWGSKHCPLGSCTVRRCSMHSGLHAKQRAFSQGQPGKTDAELIVQVDLPEHGGQQPVAHLT